MLKKIIYLLVVFGIFSCQNEDERESEIARIPVELDLRRFDQKFAEAQPQDIPELKEEFPQLFPEQYPDSVWVNRMTDTIQQEINIEVAKAYPDLKELKNELESLFQHIKYYFPDAEIPQVITLTSYVDYRNSVIWDKGFLLISLDTYLGEDHHFYTGIQHYFKEDFEPEMIVPDAAAAFAGTLIDRPDSRVFLSHMIYYGKILYLKDLLIPFKTDARKIGYTPEELKWARANEQQMWRYFVEKELLFATDTELYKRFLYPGPFSKFYLKLDSESPAQLGQYLGWQIVRQYMKNTDASVEEMLNTKAQIIFKESNYKPEK